MQHLCEYPWPGNIRELENVIERAVITSKGKELHMEEWLHKPTTAPHSSVSSDSKIQTIEEIERAHILHVLETTNWRVSGDQGAAQLLGFNRTTFEARMKKLGISRKK